MYVILATLLALQCSLYFAIRVPVEWTNENSEVNKKNEFAVEEFGPQNGASPNQRPIPTEYFQYAAHKPKFAEEIAKFHGVQSPENHYKAYPIKPITGSQKAELGKHQILNEENKVFQPYQEYVKKNAAIRVVSPSSTSYEVFHPYKSEEPALKQLYQDPVMEKIRNDLGNSIIRLQKYENSAGQEDIKKEENLESPEQTDQKKIPHKSVPPPYEIHRPQRRPIYYRPPPIKNQREQVLNQKIRHPWHQNHVKVKPANYRPVKNHLQRLRQQHALKYDDERNEYPQLPLPEKYDELPEGYDIYENGKANFIKLRNNVDESLNEAVQKNRPVEKQHLELNDDEYEEDTNADDNEDDFVPIKNYAQVRKTETTKHLPREAAYRDADTLEEIQNAPRLREAIKSTKAQTVYSEEGYEDSAYDHAGEQKHASDHEEHRGVLKEKERSNGKFKSPTYSTENNNEERSKYRDQVIDEKKWNDSKQNMDKEIELEEYSENEHEKSDESDNENIDSESEPEDVLNYDSQEDKIKRIKREQINVEKLSHHDENKQESIKIHEINLNTSHPTEKTILKLSTSTIKVPQITDNINDKYPYYYNKRIDKNSPLRYAENLKFIPNKSEGGTEFYDSRGKYQCPEVEGDIDPLPEKLKKDGHPDDDEEGDYEDPENGGEEQDKSDSRVQNQMPRLRGLGDKIDCFKAKYFGQNPLDSPFFKEDIISNPEPVTIPSIDIYRLKQAKQQSTQNGKITSGGHLFKEPKEINNNVKQHNIKNPHIEIDAKTLEPKMNKEQVISLPSRNITQVDSEINQNSTNHTGTKHLNHRRKKRAAPFVYEPYKIIRDSQIQDSKKTTTTNNISPLIKQLQSSRVVDKVAINTGKEQIVKRNARTYKDIGKNEREKNTDTKGSQPHYDAKFIDVSVDQRRGEPRYELISANHKSQYSPVENKRSMNLEDYKAQTTSDTKITNQQENKPQNKRKPNRRRRTTTARPYFDVSKFLPQENNIPTITTQSTTSPSEKSVESSENKESYVESDENRNIHESDSITTKRTLSKKLADTMTTIKPDTPNSPKLRLTTRFRNSFQPDTPIISERTEIPTPAFEDAKGVKVPKYREKKKKISKSTLVTDTNSYGEDNDDDFSKEEEVDALIGVNHDIKEYIPIYEKKAGIKDSSSDSHSEVPEGDEDYEDSHHNYDDDEDDDDDDDDDNDSNDDDDNEETEDDEDQDEDEDEAETEEELQPEITTSESTKITLIRTTETPFITTEARNAKLEIEPIIVKKKLDIHKELPVNRSSPHITEFKQDIKEIEIIKEVPPRKKKVPQKNIEALELYKDENLAKDVNKLGGVEIFKEGLDLINGPKHGGNYRIAETVTTEDSPPTSSLRRQKENSSKDDVVASQSKTSKIVEIKNDPYSRRRSDIQRARNNRNRSAKIIELSDSTERPTSRSMHGGNFKSIHDVRRRGGSRNAKLIELVDQTNRDDHSTNKQDGNSRSYGSRGGDRHQMHGGNYRSAKLIKSDDKIRTETENIAKKDSSTDGRKNSAVFLNSFARDVSVMPTPAPYILDPSKRMYYYVEA